MTIEIKEKAIEILEPEGDIVAAILFGSFATGHSSEESDVDIAVIVSSALELELQFELQEKLSEALKRRVDLLQINSNLSLVLRNEIARDGKELFSKDPNVSLNFFIKSPQLYADLMFTRASLEDSYIEKAL